MNYERKTAGIMSDYSEHLISQAGGDGEQRDPERIPEVLNALRRYWTARPDMRLGQILGNYGIDYNTEDRVLLEALRGGPEQSADVSLWVTINGHPVSTQFTNVPVTNVHNAIDALNGEPVPTVSQGADSGLYGRTKDFTEKELFPHHGNDCLECGGIVLDRVKHVTWHNKLLP